MSVLKRRLETGLKALREGDVEYAEDIIQELTHPSQGDQPSPIAGLAPSAEAMFHELSAGVFSKKKDTRRALEAAEQHRIVSAEDEDALEYDFDEEEEFFVEDDELDCDDESASVEDEDIMSFDDAWDEENEFETTETKPACSCSSHKATHSTNTTSLQVPIGPNDRVLVESVHYSAPGSYASATRAHAQGVSVETDGLDSALTMRTVDHVKATISLEMGDALPEEFHDIVDLPEGVEDQPWDELHIEELRVVKTTLVFRDGTQKTSMAPLPPVSSASDDELYYEEIIE